MSLWTIHGGVILFACANASHEDEVVLASYNQRQRERQAGDQYRPSVSSADS